LSLQNEMCPTICFLCFSLISICGHAICKGRGCTGTFCHFRQISHQLTWSKIKEVSNCVYFCFSCKGLILSLSVWTVGDNLRNLINRVSCMPWSNELANC
jgi:hypothetical protein